MRVWRATRGPAASHREPGARPQPLRVFAWALSSNLPSASTPARGILRLRSGFLPVGSRSAIASLTPPKRLKLSTNSYGTNCSRSPHGGDGAHFPTTEKASQIDIVIVYILYI